MRFPRLSLVLSLVLLSSSLSFAAPPASTREAALNRPRRIIFNNDGGETRVPTEPITASDAFLAVRTIPLQGSQVDTIAFDTTAGSFCHFAHKTSVGEMFLVREGRYQFNLLPDLLKRGTDPLRIVSEYCRRIGHEVFWTMRMNDTHDAGNSLLLTKLKHQHPDWLLGSQAKRPRRGAWSAVDYGVPEVRTLARRSIAEVAANYDIDGIELDFWRHPVFFRCTADEIPAGDDERALMTDLLRHIRADLDAAGKRRGRHILLAIKTPDSVGYCRDLGLDIERWLAEGLVDLFIPGGYFQLNQWSYSVALAHKYGVKIYACLPENRLRDATAKRERASIECLRARALAAWAAGADGIEMFNHFDPRAPLWNELGDPDLLRKRPKTYFASVQGASSSRAYFPAGAHFALPSLTPDAPEKIPPGTERNYELFVGDDLSANSALRARLLLRVSSASGEPPRIRWDDTLVQVSRANPKTWSVRIDPGRVTPGPHRISVASSGSEIRLTDLLLRIERNSPAKK